MTKAQKNRMDSLYADNLSKTKEITGLLAQTKGLMSQNLKLKKEQQEFQAELKKEIDKITAMTGFARWWGAAKLIINLIDTIEKGFKK